MATATAENKQVLKGEDAFAALKQLAEKQQQGETAVDEPETLEQLEAITSQDYQERPVELPAGWRMREWRQKHLMAIYEDGPLLKALDGEYDNRWRRNDDVVKSVLRHGGFDVVNVTEADIDGMHWQDVEMIYLAIVAHYSNTVLIKKK